MGRTQITYHLHGFGEGEKDKTGELPITNDGTYGDFKEFLEILEMHLVSLGISSAKQVLLLADGAEWIWKHIPPLLKRLNCPTPYQLLDFDHVTEHLQDGSRCSFWGRAREKNLV